MAPVANYLTLYMYCCCYSQLVRLLSGVVEWLERKHDISELQPLAVQGFLLNIRFLSLSIGVVLHVEIKLKTHIRLA